MSLLAWAKAKSELGTLFAEWPPRWPQRMAPVHLARLQAPPVGKDFRLTNAIAEAIAGACTAGELVHESADFTFPPLVFGCDTEDSADEMRAKWRAQCFTTRLPAVAAGDFVAWLRTQGEEPSGHIAAWLKATGRPAAAPPAEHEPDSQVESADSGARVVRRTLASAPLTPTPVQRTVPTASTVVRPVQRQAAWAEAILSALIRAGFNPLQLPAPKGLKSPAKAAALAALPDLTKPVFNKAWQTLRKEGRIADGP